MKSIIKPKVQAFRYGFEKTGMEVTFVRCETCKDLGRYYASIPGGRMFGSEDLPYGYSQTRFEPVLAGLIPEAADGALLSSQIIVTGHEHGEVDEAQEARLWDHEIGHIAFDISHWGIDQLFEWFELPAPDDIFKSEVSARVNEWLGTCLRHSFYGGEKVQSSLPFALPWAPQFEKG